MFYDAQDKRSFLQGELSGLRNARDAAVALTGFAENAGRRAEAETLRLAGGGDDPARLAAETHERAMRERFRQAHIQATALRDEVAATEYDCGTDGWEDSDPDEYGYAA